MSALAIEEFDVEPTCAEKLAELTEYMEKLSEGSRPYAEVVNVQGGVATLVCKGFYEQVNNQHDLSIGDSVLLNVMTGQVMEKISLPKLGAIVTVLDYIDGQIEVTLPGGVTALVNNATGVNPKSGSKVVLSKEQVSAVYVLPEPEKKKTDITPVTWEMIGGQEEAKAEIREAIEYPHKHKKIWAHYKKRIPKGILLFGAPGCGKSLIGRALATSLGVDFLFIKGPEILDPYVGVSEANLRSILRQARAGKLLFIDEADALLGTRSNHSSSVVDKTIVPTFLSEIDGIEDFRGTVVLATNRPDTLDPAVLRDGRMDRKIEVKRPGLEEVACIFDIYLKSLPTEGENLHRIASEMVFSEEMKLPNGKPFHSLASGALVEGIVDKATSFAIKRDMESKRLSRITEEDLYSGTVSAFRQNQYA